MSNTDKLAYSVKEAASRISVSPNTVRREIADGVLRCRTIRGRIVITRNELSRYLGLTTTEVV